jgi:hypothetical protein
MSRHNPELERRWRALLTEWKQSDLTISAFCECHDLTKPTFGYWQKKLGIVRRGHTTSLMSHPLSNSFIPVSVVADPLVEVRVPGGVSFKLPLACDQESIRRWLTAARDLAC